MMHILLCVLKTKKVIFFILRKKKEWFSNNDNLLPHFLQFSFSCGIGIYTHSYPNTYLSSSDAYLWSNLLWKFRQPELRKTYELFKLLKLSLILPSVPIYTECLDFQRSRGTPTRTINVPFFHHIQITSIFY